MKNSMRFKPGMHYGVGDILAVTDGTTLNLLAVKELQWTFENDVQACKIVLRDADGSSMSTSSLEMNSDFKPAGDHRLLVGVIYGDDLSNAEANVPVRVEDKNILITDRFLIGFGDGVDSDYAGFSTDDYTGRKNETRSLMDGAGLVHLRPEHVGDENAYSVYLGHGNCVADFISEKMAQAYKAVIRTFLKSRVDPRENLCALEVTLEDMLNFHSGISTLKNAYIEVENSMPPDFVLNSEHKNKLIEWHEQLRPSFVKRLFPYKKPDGNNVLGFYVSNKRDMEISSRRSGKPAARPVYAYEDSEIITEVDAHNQPRDVSTTEAIWFNKFNDASLSINDFHTNERILPVLYKTLRMDCRTRNYDVSVVKHYAKPMTAEQMAADLVDSLIPLGSPASRNLKQVAGAILPMVLVRDRLSRIWYRPGIENNDFVPVPYPHVREGDSIASASWDFDVHAENMYAAANMAAGVIASTGMPMDDDGDAEAFIREFSAVWVITEDDERVLFGVHEYVSSTETTLRNTKWLEIIEDQRYENQAGMQI